jgi:hypothetical protein
VVSCTNHRCYLPLALWMPATPTPTEVTSRLQLVQVCNTAGSSNFTKISHMFHLYTGEGGGRERGKERHIYIFIRVYIIHELMKECVPVCICGMWLSCAARWRHRAKYWKRKCWRACTRAQWQSSRSRHKSSESGTCTHTYAKCTMRQICTPTETPIRGEKEIKKEREGVRYCSCVPLFVVFVFGFSFFQSHVDTT